jgi:hypothetical protein
MLRLGVCLGLLCVSLGALPRPAAADGSRSGKIDEARERMSEKSNDDDSDDDDDDSDDDDSSLLDDDDGEDSEPGVLGQAIGRMLFYGLGFPFWGPQLIVGDREPMRQYVFRPYPYASGSEGPFRILKLNEQGEPSEAAPLAASLRMMASYERHAENLDGRRLRLTLRTNLRVGLDAELTRYDEVLGPGDQDSLWHYQGLVTGAFAISSRTQFTFGFGLRGIRFSGDDHHTHIATHYAVEVFPVRPLHVWLLGEASIGQDTWATEAEAGLGVILHRFEVFGGYRRFNLVGVHFAGPEVGVMAWF